MKSNKITSIIIILVFILGQTSISIIKNPVFLFNENTNEIFQNLIEKNKIKIESNQDYETERDYVIFSSNHEEFSLLRQMDTSRIFENLEAITISLNYNEYNEIKNLFLDRVVKLSEFNKINFQPVPTKIALTPDNTLEEQSQIDIKRMWDLGYNGTGVNVTVFDNGVSQSHPGLVGQVVQSVNFLPAGYTQSDISYSHGTPVAGVIASTGKKSDGTTDLSLRGSAFGASIISVNIDYQVDTSNFIGDFLSAFDWIIANNASIDVVNMSWGRRFIDYGIVIKKLTEANIISVVAGGNTGPNLFSVSGGPEMAADSIAVGASYGADIASWSSRGPMRGYVFKPELVAPGMWVSTTNANGGYSLFSGTSFSSPMVAGAVATIISALNANSISYNPGLIKAVLMNNATDLKYDEMSQGRGLIQTYKSWENILNAEIAGDGIPMAIDMLPRSGSLPFSSLKTMFRDINDKIPFTLVSSHAGLTTVELTGDITSIMSFDPSSIDPDADSQFLYLDIDTHGVSEGNYDGILTVSLGNKAKISAHYSITVLGEVKARALLDIRHTWWDSTGQDVIGGSNIGEMVNIARSKGIWITEYHTEITSAALADYDIIWMPDPFGRSYSPNDPEIAEIMTANEIISITNFVDSGGKLLVDFNGKLINSEGGYYGTNATEANRLLSQFDILASDTAVTVSSETSVIGTNNITSPVGGIEYISHAGNYLSVSGNAKGIMGSGSRITTAIYDDLDSSGRVLVASSNYWMDNTGLNGGYNGKGNDRLFAENVWDWFLTDTQVKFISSFTTKTTIKGQFKVLEDGVPIPTSPVVKRIGNDLLSSLDIIPTNIGGDIWEFTYDITAQGYHNLQVVYGSEYAAWSLKFDTEAPTVIPIGIVNGSIYVEGTSLILSFEVKDLLSVFGAADIHIYLDGVNIDENINKAYIIAENKLNILIKPSLFSAAAGHEYILTISVSDIEGNETNFNFHFFLGEFESIPTQPTTQQSNTTTPIESLPSGTTSETPLSIAFTIISILGIAVLKYRKRKILNKEV